MPGDSPRFDLYVGRCESSISIKRWRFTMKEYQSLSHTRWDCKYHVVFIPKRRKKAIFGALRKNLGAVFHELALQRECKVIEGHLMRDHVHMCLSIPPKFSVSSVVGDIKGKSAISIARHFGGRQRNFTGEVFWARGYFVSTVGLDEEMVRAYIRNQEHEDERYGQMKLGL
jgi:putative transposase